MLTFSIQLKPAESCSASNVHLRPTGCVLWNWRTEQLQRLSKDSDSSLHSKGDGVHIGTVLKSGTHAMSAGTAVVAKGVGEVTSSFQWEGSGNSRALAQEMFRYFMQKLCIYAQLEDSAECKRQS